MNHFAKWMTFTHASIALRHQESWLTPGIQSVHIVGIAVVIGSVLMIVLRILGWAGTDLTLRQTAHRFGPWLIGGLCFQLVTGIVMIMTEPVRELVNFSFWTKMIFVAIGTVLAVIFLISVPNHEQRWETLASSKAIKSLAVVTLVIFLCIIVLGRLIAYDHIWGSWSPATNGY